MKKKANITGFIHFSLKIKMIKSLKKFLKTIFLPDLVYALVELWLKTEKFFYINLSAPDYYHEKGQPLIVLSWHGRIMFVPPTPWSNKVKILVSPSEDGDMLIRYLGKFGYEFVRGSSRKGGEEAKKLLLQALKEGYDIFITPDGPTGPYHIVKPGALELALASGAPIFLLMVTSTKSFQFKTWDRFCIPLPFGKVFVFLFGPYWIKGEDDLSFIQNEMTSLEKIIDWIVGRLSDGEAVQVNE